MERNRISASVDSGDSWAAVHCGGWRWRVLRSEDRRADSGQHLPIPSVRHDPAGRSAASEVRLEVQEREGRVGNAGHHPPRHLRIG